MNLIKKIINKKLKKRKKKFILLLFFIIFFILYKKKFYNIKKNNKNFLIKFSIQNFNTNFLYFSIIKDETDHLTSSSVSSSSSPSSSSLSSSLYSSSNSLSSSSTSLSSSPLYSSSSSLPISSKCFISSNYKTFSCTPLLIIIGAMKCGTGELMKLLQLSPSFSLGKDIINNKNELHFFTKLIKEERKRKIEKEKELKKQEGEREERELKREEMKEVKENDEENFKILKKYSENFTNYSISLISSSLSSSSTLSSSSFSSSSLSSSLSSSSSTSSSLSSLYLPIFYEKSPDYIRNKEILYKISKLLPSIRLILLLRDPLKRLFSEISHHCRHKRYIKKYLLNNNFIIKRINNIDEDLNNDEEVKKEKEDNDIYLSKGCLPSDIYQYFSSPSTSSSSSSFSSSSSSNYSIDYIKNLPEVKNSLYSSQLDTLFT